MNIILILIILYILSKMKTSSDPNGGQVGVYRNIESNNKFDFVETQKLAGKQCWCLSSS